MALSSELVGLVEQEIPEGRQSLSDSHTNLEKVAAYCIENFARTDNKAAALEETKNYTTQSLASVAYQINTLAYNFLQMVEQQANQLAEMESQVNYISQMVMVHKEKVARREIGVLTTNKTTARQYKILAPANTEKPIKYVRKPIDFTGLDDVGHGMRSSSSTPRSRRSGQSSGAPPPPPHSHYAPSPPTAGPAPTTKPPTPPQASRSVSSLSRGSREYRTPPAVVAPPQVQSGAGNRGRPRPEGGQPIPPLRDGESLYQTSLPTHNVEPVPSNYAPNYPIGHPRRNDRGGYSTLPHPPAAALPPPQVGMVHPLPQQPPPQALQGSYTPPPPPPHMEPPQYAGHTVSLPRYPTVIRPAMTLPKSLTAKNNKPSLTILTQAPPLAPPSPAAAGMVEVEYPPPSPRPSSPPLPPPPPHATEVELPPPAIPPHFMEKGEDENQVNPTPPTVPPHYLEKVIAVYDYSADKEDELTFNENAVIYVLKKNDDGWWEGVMNGVTGLFPGNYVEPLM